MALCRRAYLVITKSGIPGRGTCLSSNREKCRFPGGDPRAIGSHREDSRAVGLSAGSSRYTNLHGCCPEIRRLLRGVNDDQLGEGNLPRRPRGICFDAYLRLPAVIADLLKIQSSIDPRASHGRCVRIVWKSVMADRDRGCDENGEPRLFTGGDLSPVGSDRYDNSAAPPTGIPGWSHGRSTASTRSPISGTSRRRHPLPRASPLPTASSRMCAPR